jgi:hypothetical protein
MANIQNWRSKNSVIENILIEILLIYFMCINENHIFCCAKLKNVA